MRALGFHPFLLYSAGLSRVHVVQQMAGWECNDETGDIIGNQQYGYDGKDFISLDLRTLQGRRLSPNMSGMEINADMNFFVKSRLCLQSHEY